MRRNISALVVLVLLLWQYQQLQQQDEHMFKNQSVSSQSTNTVNVKVESSSALTAASIPNLDNNLNWLQPKLKVLFDHYLLDYKQSPKTMWLEFDSHCKTLVNCDSITELFHRYVAYKKALTSVDEPEEQKPKAISELLTRLDAIRQEFFSKAEIDVLFADEQTWQQAALERLAIRQNAELTNVQKKSLLMQSYQTLDDSAYLAVKPTLQLQQLSQMSASRELNANDYNQLAAEYGIEAAERLLLVAGKQQVWQQKVEQYQQLALELESSLEGTEKTHAINELKTEMFSTNEIKRLNVLLSKHKKGA